MYLSVQGTSQLLGTHVFSGFSCFFPKESRHDKILQEDSMVIRFNRECGRGVIMMILVLAYGLRPTLASSSSKVQAHSQSQDSPILVYFERPKAD